MHSYVCAKLLDSKRHIKIASSALPFPHTKRGGFPQTTLSLQITLFRGLVVHLVLHQL